MLLLNSIVLSAAEKRRYFLQQEYFEEGENTVHLLALVAKEQRDTSSILAIRPGSAEMHNLNSDTLSVFYQFYIHFYSSKTNASPLELESFLQDCPFPQVSETDWAMLSSPITIEDLTEALVGTKNHKSPGSDGIPMEVYSCYGDVLLPPILQALFEALETGHLPDSLQETIIVVIPKPQNDRLLPVSYCPISLLNSDFKLLA